VIGPHIERARGPRRILGDMADRIYRLVVEGELSDDLEHAFDGVRLERIQQNTALTGTRDQAELHALLRRISDLGLTLLEVTVIDDGLGSRPAPGRYDSWHTAPERTPGGGRERAPRAAD
jgi:hypothetical protein